MKRTTDPYLTTSIALSEWKEYRQSFATPITHEDAFIRGFACGFKHMERLALEQMNLPPDYRLLEKNGALDQLMAQAPKPKVIR